MNKNETMIPEHVNYLMNLLKSYEMFFRKNMENLDINIGEIPILMEIYANEGPTLKRIRPRAQGRAFRIRKRTSHITIVVKEKE